MAYLNFERLEAIDPSGSPSQMPFPWANPADLLWPEAYEALRTTLPEFSLFDARFGIGRPGDQAPHDRYRLEYRDGTPVSDPWREFIGELRSERYRQAICRLLGVPGVTFNFHWFYTPTGCSISPHVDAAYKIGTHIFYFDRLEDWEPTWGGETLLLHTPEELDPTAAPGFDDFEHAIAAVSLGNRSLIFKRTDNSWHGVRELRCPADRMRKIFVVVFNRDGFLDRARQALSTKKRY